MLVSTVLVLLPSTSADGPAEARNIEGYIYVDGLLTEPNKLILSLPEGDYQADTWTNGFYIVMGEGSDGETGEFYVTLPGGTWKSQETITIKQNIWDYEINLTIDTSEPQDNNCPDKPTTPNPSNGASDQPTTASLSVYVNDEDGDTLTVSFYDASDDSLISTDNVASSGTASVSWSGLENSQTYQWYAVSSDGTCDSPQSDTWSFTTKEKTTPKPPSPPTPPSGGGGGDGDNFVPPANRAPVADAGGPYFGTPGEEIEFDGTKSNDSDGEIVSYSWNFGDENTASGVTSTHTYVSAGEYTVTLTVEDDDGATDTDTKTVLIAEANNPPEDPTITGPSEGEINVSYNFTFVSTDNDNDTIQYIIDWGDGTNTTTDFLPNGTSTKQTHIWTNAGAHTITVKAYDNDTNSGSVTHTITISEPADETPKPEPKEQDNTIYYIAGLVIVIILILIAFLATKKKK